MPTNYNGYTVPEPTDIADAPAAFEEFSDSIPFNEYVAIESLSADTTVVDSYNGKMIFATADLTLTFGTLTDGFSVAVTADTGVTVDYLGVNLASQQTTAFQIATVVAVNGTNIISIAGGGSTPCPPCPPVGTPDATITAITGSGITHTYGSYIAYEFRTSGTITCTEGIVLEALLIGGGGAASVNLSGGGGAGGYIELGELFLSGSTHSVTVGTGGALNSNGNATEFLNYYVLPGGAGGSNTAANHPNDVIGYLCGSGGGGGIINADNAAGGLGLSGQGFDGGLGNVSDFAAGGGGGAYEVGADFGPGASDGGDGGDGLASSITGTSVYRAAGGGGYGNAGVGQGGLGGGGTAATGAGNATDGTAGTGSGGGGANTGVSGNGGSGVVIVKVLATNASSVDTSGWTEVTAAMVTAVEKKRKAEVKKVEKRLALEAKSEELSGQTNKTDIKETK